MTDIETGKKTGMIPDFEAMVEWYKTHLPDESKTGLRIVHGDYKLDNMIFHPTEDRVIGILDWELCTLGSPVSSYSASTQLYYTLTQTNSSRTSRTSPNHGPSTRHSPRTHRA